jgi:hypothetical protein
VGPFVIAAKPQTAFYSARALATIVCHSAVKLGDKLYQPVGEHKGNVLAVCLASLEFYEAHFRRGQAHDAIVFTVPVGELALYLGESMGIIHREQYRPR